MASQNTFGYCQDTYCDSPDEQCYLVDGYCTGCYEAQQDEESFREANHFDMYDDDFGQVKYGVGYN